MTQGMLFAPTCSWSIPGDVCHSPSKWRWGSRVYCDRHALKVADIPGPPIDWVRLPVAGGGGSRIGELYERRRQRRLNTWENGDD